MPGWLFASMGIFFVSWFVVGVKQGIPLLAQWSNALEIPLVGFFLIYFLLAMFYIGVPIYTCYFVTLLWERKSFSEAFRTSVREYTSTTAGMLIGIPGLLLIAIIGGNILAALHFGALVAIAGAIIVAVYRKARDR